MAYTQKVLAMKHTITMATTVVCTFALSACGGGSSAPSRADEGIWISEKGELQSIILSDGTYWGIYGSPALNTAPVWLSTMVQHGTASISGNNISGTYTESSMDGYSTCPMGSCTSSSTGGSYYSVSRGSYSGSVSSQNIMTLTFNDDNVIPYIYNSNPGSDFSLSYDDIYSQSISLLSIVGNYSGSGTFGGSTPSTVTISNQDRIPGPGFSSSLNQNLSITDESWGGCMIYGTVIPHGSVGIFDVNFSFVTPLGSSGCPLYGYASGLTEQSEGTYRPFTGVLLQTTSGGKNIIQIVATDNAPDYPNYFFLWGAKQ